PIAGTYIDHVGDLIVAVDHCSQHFGDQRPACCCGTEVDVRAVNAPESVGTIRRFDPGVEPGTPPPCRGLRGARSPRRRMREHGPLVPDAGSLTSSPFQANSLPSFPAPPPLPALPRRLAAEPPG